MTWKLAHRVVATLVFAYALLLYLLTLSPTASFWDSGEFIASVYRLEVMHPPGAPFYMLVGRLFSMFVPPEHVAVAVNIVSALASAFTVLFTHLVIVRLVQAWQGRRATWGAGQHLVALLGGIIGACAFAATDTFWFNAVEAEVYAFSMFFTAIVVWLVMKWSEAAQDEEEALRLRGHQPFALRSNRYLVVIAYLFGLALGVHLLNLLALFFIALIVFWREFDKDEWTPKQRFGYLVLAGVVSVIAFGIIFPGVVLWLPSLADASGVPFLFFLSVAALAAFSVWYTHTRRMPLANLIAVSITVVLIGYSSYALIFIRSAADPPIDLNDPETAEDFVSYLKREQYGSTPLFNDATYDNALGRINTQETVAFPRRHSPDRNHWRIYQQYDGDWDFFVDYQVGHMYMRYFLWNFAGRESDRRDAPALTGLPFFDDVLLERQEPLASPSEEASRNRYFLLPLLLGLIGASLHAYYDWRRALAVFVLFFITGIGIILYLNQPPMQPRERDYAYVASFFAFSLWIGIGAAGLLNLVREALTRDAIIGTGGRLALVGAGALIFAAVPGWMAAENYDDHDRSGRYVATDYAYNLLMSVEENAIIFTNGDNDTYPLWYLQEVEGVRPDVRVVNLSLLNTPWYVKQLKEQWANESAPLPITLTDEQIEELAFVPWQPREVALPVDKEALTERFGETAFGAADTSEIVSPMRWTLQGRPYSQDLNYLYAADVAVLNMLQTVARQGWERPIYFAITVSPDGMLDLDPYFQLEGKALRVVPIRSDGQGLGRIDPEITPERLERFRFTNLDDPDVYFDENIRQMVDNYRFIYARVAQRLAEAGHPERAEALLDTLMAEVPFATIPGDVNTFLLMARAYQAAGADEQAAEVVRYAEPLALHAFATAQTQRDVDYALQLMDLVRTTYLFAGAFDRVQAFSDRLAETLQDDAYRISDEELRALEQQFRATQDTPTVELPATDSVLAVPAM